MTYQDQILKLAVIARDIYEQHAGYIKKLKTRGDNEFKRDDFIWHFLLQSFSTMGRSSGWKGLIGNKNNYNQLRYENLLKLDKNQREITIKNVCHAAKLRMPDKKAEYINKCFVFINDLGGLEITKSKLLSANGREKKIKFLKSFPGIGPKYARNIMMDVYHKEFRESIAIDSRIKSISDILEVSFKNYEEHEAFFLEVAHAAKLNGWELDRLMYRFQSDFEYELVMA